MNNFQKELSQFIDDNKGEKQLDVILKKKLIDCAIIKCRGNQTKAAKMLGISRATLRKFL